MRAVRVQPGEGIGGLRLTECDHEELGPAQVRIKVHAVSLNFRDLMIVAGRDRAAKSPLIPCSDGAGEVIQVGSAVTHFKPGDRVMAAFFPRWIDGPPTRDNTAIALGGSVDGLLADERVIEEDALASIPRELGFAEAATLPCAGVTAWNAMFVAAGLEPGDSVLLLGTGGVSVMALQLAKACGLKTIITSSSDDKLERARGLGADATINYATCPAWDKEVRRLTSGGVDAVIEVGGEGTLARSIAATRMGGVVAIVGGVSGFTATLDTMGLVAGTRTLAGVCVGSRVILEELATRVAAAAMRPVIDRTFRFAEASEAFRYLESQRHFGKVVIEVRA